MAARTKEVGIRLSVKDTEVVKKALAGIGKDGQAALKTIERAAAPASTSLLALNRAAQGVHGSIGSFVGRATSGLIPVLTLSAAIMKTRQAMEDFGEIADKSKSAGIDPEFFQGLAYQSKLAGVEIGQLSGALDTFHKNAGLAAEGKGRMVTQLKALNPELLKNIQLARTQEERIRLVADALDRAKTSNEKAATAAAAFGDAGVDLVSVFAGGSAEIDRMLAKAREIGIVVDRELIARADELGDEFDTLSSVLDTQLKEVLIELAPFLTGFVGLLAELAKALRDIGAAVPENIVDARTNDKLRGDIADWKRMLASDDWLWDRGNVERQLAAAETEVRRRKTRGPFDNVGTGPGSFGEINRLVGKPGEPPALPEDPAASKAREQQAKRISDVTDALNRQLAALTETDREQAVANELARAHVTLATTDGQAIAALTGQLFDQRAALLANNEAATFFAQTTEKAFEGMIEGSKSLTDVLGDVTKALMQAVLQASLLGSGPLAGLLGTKPATSGDPGGVLGSLFSSIVGGVGGGGGIGRPATGLGGLWADGGFTGVGGKHDPAGIVHRGEYVFSAEATAKAGAANLDRMHKRLRSFASGGYVGGSPVAGNDNLTVNVSIVRMPGSGEDSATASRRGNMLDVKAFIHETVAQGASTPGNPINRALRVGMGGKPPLTRR